MVAALGSHPFDMASYNPPHGQGSGSGSAESGSASGNYSIPLGDAQPDQPPPFDLSDYILMEPGVGPTNFIPPPILMQGPLMQGGMSAPQMESAVFQAAQNSAGVNIPTSTAAMERPRTERIAFRMQSEIEIVDDGYKWRKYGKKSVKDSPNPRNYYRCSTEGCSVKKRVERDKDDPSYVITTYEGVHNHVSPTVVYDARQDAASGRYYVAGMAHMPPSSLGN
ncbi:putative WRKY transcription factor 50 [Carex littledalei]|uniref:Putative WRKY transcription factor 50 n=1 Tax=Carex littledalei TaxID=544730 RepID=A0A833VM30_9POAL|nr:putative WRKY transcription factor 50 [Carex littledalei]